MIFFGSYDNTNGIFTIPPGGDGVYYFSTYLYVHGDEYAHFDMTLNGDVICTTRPDLNGSTGADYPSGSCSAVVDVVAGDAYSKSACNESWNNF